jgi:hypothetical protein
MRMMMPRDLRRKKYLRTIGISCHSDDNTESFLFHLHFLKLKRQEKAGKNRKRREKSRNLQSFVSSRSVVVVVCFTSSQAKTLLLPCSFGLFVLSERRNLQIQDDDQKCKIHSPLTCCVVFGPLFILFHGISRQV